MCGLYTLNLDWNTYLPRCDVGDYKLYLEVEFVQLMEQNTCHKEMNDEWVLKINYGNMTEI